ncbi:MAG: serine hydrolase domain-containing protein [Devosia sp.]
MSTLSAPRSIGTTIHGHVAPGFAPVAEAFAAAFDDPRSGAALSIWRGGEPIADLWGGTADARDSRPWQEDTIGVVFSCTKGLVSILAAQLIEAGRLDPDAPVSRYWPEYAANGKAGTQVRHLLAHRAGLSAPTLDITTAEITDWAGMVRKLEQQEPLWPPGEAYAYHAITHGWLVGEVLRRVTGRTVGQLFAESITGPLGVDAWIGLPAKEMPRVAHLTPSEAFRRQLADAAASRPPGAVDWSERAATLGTALPPTLAEPAGGFNDQRLWAAEIPGAGGIMSARALAKIWSATVADTGGRRLLQPATVERLTVVESEGPPVFPVPPPWSRWGMGFQLDSETRRFVTGRGFGHDGAGGQCGFAEPGLGIGFGFITHFMQGGGDLRATRIIDALRLCLVDQGAMTVANS